MLTSSDAGQAFDLQGWRLFPAVTVAEAAVPGEPLQTNMGKDLEIISDEQLTLLAATSERAGSKPWRIGKVFSGTTPRKRRIPSGGRYVPF